MKGRKFEEREREEKGRRNDGEKLVSVRGPSTLISSSRKEISIFISLISQLINLLILLWRLAVFGPIAVIPQLCILCLSATFFFAKRNVKF